MFYLALINQFKKISGFRGEHDAPYVEQKYFTLVDQETRYHYIVDPRLTTSVLDDAVTYKQDIFLSKILEEKTFKPDTGLQWISYFVSNSPEFKDGADHNTARQMLKNILSHIHSSWFDNIKLCESFFLEACARPGTTKSADMSKEIVRYYLQRIFSLLLAKEIRVSDAVLNAPDIFTPTVKLKANLQHLNRVVDDFLFDNNIEANKLSPGIMLAILSFIYMSVRPLSACLTVLFNELIRTKLIKSPRYYLGFNMVPTYYVAREATKNTTLSDLFIFKGDKLYLYLYDSAGCPFSREIIAPFGKGKHLCPGLYISKMIVNEVIECVNNYETAQILASSLVPSAPLTKTSNAFLSFAT